MLSIDGNHDQGEEANEADVEDWTIVEEYIGEYKWFLAVIIKIKKEP